MLARAYSFKVRIIFGVRFERQIFSLIKKQTYKTEPEKQTWKLKHANSILETFEYFCQISPKSISIILSYTISKLVHF